MDDLISRQAAIDALDTGLWGVEWDKALATAMLKDLPSAQQWIPVSEMLPEVGETVLLACKEYGFNCCEYMTQKIGIYNTNCGNIVAWMPLPEPYKEEKG